MERATYIKSMLNEHLLKGGHYSLLSKNEATRIMDDFESELSDLLRDEFVDCLSDDGKTYFKRGFETAHRIPQLYGMPKVYKDYTTSVPLRPVNSQVGLLSAMVSKYIDYYLKILVPFIPSFVKN